ncbi:MAG: hypothetical protein KGZ58_11240 [Ignavibacteriales bacterium]|nr:hypothetical protein [Ignavibacteriales bacterium]
MKKQLNYLVILTCLIQFSLFTQEKKSNPLTKDSLKKSTSVKEDNNKVEKKESVQSNSESKEKKKADSTLVIEKKQQPQIVSFSKDVYPLIDKHCMPCHAEEEENPSELHFDSYESLFEGGKNGSPILVGKGDSSLIVKKLRPNPAFGNQMPLPKKKEKLSEDVIKIFVQWINQGAKNN